MTIDLSTVRAKISILSVSSVEKSYSLLVIGKEPKDPAGHQRKYIKIKTEKPLYQDQLSCKELCMHTIIASLLHKQQAAMAEWLRRWTRNPMGFSRAGSNPVRSEIFL